MLGNDNGDSYDKDSYLSAGLVAGIIIGAMLACCIGAGAWLLFGGG